MRPATQLMARHDIWLSGGQDAAAPFLIASISTRKTFTITMPVDVDEVKTKNAKNPNNHNNSTNNKNNDNSRTPAALVHLLRLHWNRMARQRAFFRVVILPFTYSFYSISLSSSHTHTCAYAFPFVVRFSWYAFLHDYSARAPEHISICSTLMSAERLGCERFGFVIT